MLAAKQRRTDNDAANGDDLVLQTLDARLPHAASLSSAPGCRHRLWLEQPARSQAGRILKLALTIYQTLHAADRIWAWHAMSEAPRSRSTKEVDAMRLNEEGAP